jgi:hypothetical protein
MISKTINALRRRVGPVGLSLLAAALTAVAFAAFAVAKDDNSTNGNGGGDVQRAAPGGPGEFRHQLSDADKQKLEEFRQCMSDQGVDPPPRPDQGKSGSQSRPKPPSEKERAKIDKAFQACKDKLPEGAQAMGPHPPCGPPPGAGPQQQQGQQGQQEQQGYAVPAPQGSTS